jgi:hypothetical protein
LWDVCGGGVVGEPADLRGSAVVAMAMAPLPTLPTLSTAASHWTTGSAGASRWPAAASTELHSQVAAGAAGASAARGRGARAALLVAAAADGRVAVYRVAN